MLLQTSADSKKKAAGCFFNMESFFITNKFNPIDEEVIKLEI